MNEMNKHIIEISTDTTVLKLKYQVPREKIDIFQESLTQNVNQSLFVNREKIEKLFHHGVEDIFIVTRQTTIQTENKNTGKTTTTNEEVIECLTVVWDKASNDMYELDVSTRDYKSLEELVFKAFSAIGGKNGAVRVGMSEPLTKHETTRIEEDI